MKEKIIAIFVLMLIITTALPVVGAINSNKVNEKTFSTSSSNGGYENLIVICVYKAGIRQGKPMVVDAEVTATNLETNKEHELVYVDDDDWPGYWLQQAPIGNYHVQAKRGLRSGSITIEYAGTIYWDSIYLKFFETANVYYEGSVLSILRLLFSSLPIFR